ncbi:MAG: MarR family transcriptional regulator [Clostridiales bacterium]|nr:MarR family transcriptional regulator [Clostridiales bacterium]
MKFDENKLSQNTIIKLVICGQFLHFKVGGRASRRRIFSVLSERGEMPQKELQEVLGVCSGSLSEILAKTEEDGFIEKTKSEKDKRNLNIKLTEAGKEKADISEKEFSAQAERMLECLTEDEKKDLFLKLSRLMEHWKKIQPEA